ncbi:MAG: hypothetical protein WBQ66_02475, partial [Blastocatellia bacterium]
AWIFFRAESVGDASAVIMRIASWADAAQPIAVPGFDGIELALAVAFVILLESVQLVQERGSVPAWLGKLPDLARLALYAALIVVILLFGRFDERAFIYFQF